MRYTIYVEQNVIDDAGNEKGTRSHVITLSNKEAQEKVAEYILNLLWLDDIVNDGDCLVYDDNLD